jgi:hypothetical protein
LAEKAKESTEKSKLHNLQYDEGGNHMAEAETKNVGTAWRLKGAVQKLIA